MTLQDLPLDIFLMIMDQLPSKVDKDCLLLTCRSFRQLAPRPKPKQHSRFISNPRHELLSSFLEDYDKNEERIELTNRIFRPGNLLSHLLGTADICINCTRVKRNDRFPLRNMLFEGGLLCEKCIFNTLQCATPPGRKFSKGGVEECQCVRCFRTKPIADMHVHAGLIKVQVSGSEIKGRLCSGCHMEVCKDPACSGWPSGFLDVRPKHLKGARKRFSGLVIKRLDVQQRRQ